MNINVKLYSPFKFKDGKQTNILSVREGSDLNSLLKLLEEENVFAYYGKDSLLTMIENRAVDNSYILKEGQTVEILLLVAGG